MTDREPGDVMAQRNSQLVVAGLIFAGGKVTNGSGAATTALAGMIPVSVAPVRQALLKLESAGIIRRDLRNTKMARDEEGLRQFGTGARCYGIYLIREDVEVDQWAVDLVLRHNGTTAPPEPVSGHSNGNGRVPHPDPDLASHPRYREAEAPTVQELAEELMQQLLDVIENGPFREVHIVETEEQTEQIEALTAENEDLRQRLAQAEANLAAYRNSNGRVDDLASRLARTSPAVAQRLKGNT